jgi:hypothetical protein
MLKEKAEEELARSEKRTSDIIAQMDNAIKRSIAFQNSRDSLVQRVDELVELLAIAHGIKKAAVK